MSLDAMAQKARDAVAGFFGVNATFTVTGSKVVISLPDADDLYARKKSGAYDRLTTEYRLKKTALNVETANSPNVELTDTFRQQGFQIVGDASSIVTAVERAATNYQEISGRIKSDPGGRTF